MTLPDVVTALIAARRVEQVPADHPSARVRLSRAEDKLASARKIAEIDIEIAYMTAYDATRMAVTAYMLANGYRVRAVGGAHEAVGTYAEGMLATPSAAEFQRMRRRRNKAEYDDIVIGRADLYADFAHAATIIEAVKLALSPTDRARDTT